MRRLLALTFSAVVLIITCAVAAEERLSISSSAFTSNESVPEQFTCKGANVNPPLRFRGIPAEAKSLALVVEDPDAPSGLFTHWLLWNIPVTTSVIGEKSVPAGAAQGTNDFGNVGYGGPCPPSGTHRYIFRLLVLDSTLDLKAGARRSEFNKATSGHVIGRAEFTGRFSAR